MGLRLTPVRRLHDCSCSVTELEMQSQNRFVTWNCFLKQNLLLRVLSAFYWPKMKQIHTFVIRSSKWIQTCEPVPGLFVICVNCTIQSYTRCVGVWSSLPNVPKIEPTLLTLSWWQETSGHQSKLSNSFVQKHKFAKCVKMPCFLGRAVWIISDPAALVFVFGPQSALCWKAPLLPMLASKKWKHNKKAHCLLSLSHSLSLSLSLSFFLSICLSLRHAHAERKSDNLNTTESPFCPSFCVYFHLKAKLLLHTWHPHRMQKAVLVRKTSHLELLNYRK